MSILTADRQLLRASEEQIKAFSLEQKLELVRQHVAYTYDVMQITCDLDEADEGAVHYVLEEAREDAWAFIEMVNS
ncbi:MAG: hypothetical protein HC874_24975 [Richelia sp. SL_2_1]|nr:hypothetical protein [Richelia sp. SM1_7_0]NJO30429.1 hypothetical protein [Richelia sp. SL_2_1]